VWSMQAHNMGACMRCVFVGAGVRPDPVNAVLFQPMNNNLLISCTMSGAVNIVNMSTGKQLQTAGARTDTCAMCMCVEQQSRTLWVGTNDGYVHAFRMHPTTSALTVAHKTLICASRMITCLSVRAWISREARDPCILVSVAANMFALYRIGANDGSLQFVRKFPINHEHLPYLRSNFCPLMSFREGACVLSGSEDRCVYLWNAVQTDTRTCLNKLQGHGDAVTDVTFNHNETYLASADNAGIVIIWKRATRVDE